MVQRPPDEDDSTGEEEALELDGTHTDQLDDTYRLRVVAASESASGAFGFDDRGQARWKWITELGPAGSDASGTFDQIKALENPALSIEDERHPLRNDLAKPATIPTPPASFPTRQPAANTVRTLCAMPGPHYLNICLARLTRFVSERTARADSERMTRIEVDDLRARCRAAFAVYEAHVSTVIEHSKGGASPARGKARRRNLHFMSSARHGATYFTQLLL